MSSGGLRFDAPMLGRIYCAFIALLLMGLGFSAWSADRDTLYLGAMLCGTGLFMLVGVFGRVTRVLAMLGLCVVCSGLAFAFSLGLQVLHGEAPTSGMLTVWTLELGAGGIAFLLARELYRDLML